MLAHFQYIAAQCENCNWDGMVLQKSEQMYKRIYGFTLIEVLIAIVILSIAVTAIVKTLQVATRDLSYLQDKTLAHWVGWNALQKVQLGLLKFNSDKTLSGTETQLNKNFNWVVKESDSSDPHINTITVDVYLSPTQKLAHLQSFTGAQNAAQ